MMGGGFVRVYGRGMGMRTFIKGPNIDAKIHDTSYYIIRINSFVCVSVRSGIHDITTTSVITLVKKLPLTILQV